MTGRVHGVGFRYTTQRIGSRLGLTGWVRNERDGSVLIHAQGSEPVLDEFIKAIEIGPPAARVAAVTVTQTTFDGELTGFSVTY